MLKHTFFLLAYVYSFQCANILCVFPVPSTSHTTIHQTLSKELSLRGHQVTVITANPLNSDNLPNLTEFEISSLRDIAGTKRKLKDNYMLSAWLFAGTYYQELVEEVLIHLGTIFPDANTRFDLILVDNVNPLIYSLGCRFKALIIGISSGIMAVFNQDMLGNPSHPALYFDLTSKLTSEVNFFVRVTNFVNTVIGREFYRWYYLPFIIDRISKKYFGVQCPHIWNLQENVSLIVTNTIPVLHSIRANLPTIVETNLVKSKQKKLLPQDLQNHLDDNPQGVVYFNLDSSYNLCVVELPYKTLCNCTLQNVLFHKNIKVFVTEGDTSSVQEAISNAVPMVGIPFDLHQTTNVRHLVRMGVGLSIDHSILTQDHLKDAIIKVAENAEYRRKIGNLRDLIEDRKMQSLDEAIWWITYVLRRGNKTFLKGPAAEMYWYEFLYLDLITIVLGFVGTIVYLLVIIFNTVRKLPSFTV